MGKQGVLTLLLGVALGANVILACWIVSITLNPTPALGGTVDGAGEYTLATGRLQGRGDADALYIWSHVDKKLVVYFQSGKNLELLSTRNCIYDFRPNQYGEQRPTVQRMKKDVSGK